MRICFASHNLNKIKEINSLLPSGIDVFGLDELKIKEEIPETGDTFEENSRLKASFVHQKFGVPVFADDSGLCVESLNHEPGVYSARYAGLEKDDNKNMDLLLQNMGDSLDRKAQFKTIITYIDEKGNEHQFDGIVNGKIETEKRGTNGFGYDPIFTPDGFNQTFAELTSEQKGSISHRAIAVNKLINHLSSNQ